MKKIVAVLMAGLMVMGLVACSSEDTNSSTASSNSSQASTSEASTADESSEVLELSGTVTTGGSTSVESVVGAFIEAFREMYPDVDVTYDPTGSGAGITGASEGL